jgi:hypothetical protein
VPEDADRLEDRLRRAIVERFQESPSAADTAHGILVSWLPDQKLEAAPPALVAKVLDQMVKDRWLKEHVPTGGEPLYRRGPDFPGALDGPEK